MDINSWTKESIVHSTAREIIELYEQHGNEDYDGEPVSQSAHMIQCAMLAINEGVDTELILGAFMHDIGHLLKHKTFSAEMGGFGVVDHEGIGASFLKDKGLSERICAVVAEHVAAKRYLVATDDTYLGKLSEASLETLKWQGGPMLPEEANAFSNHPYFNDIIRVRLWDEKAKNADAALLPLSYFQNLLHEHLNHHNL